MMCPDPDDQLPVEAAGLTLVSTNPDEDDQPLPTERSMGYLRRRRDLARKRLAQALGKIDRTEDFLRMIWAIDKIGEGNKVGLGWFTTRPKLVVEWANEPHHIHKWTLESLVNAYLRSKPLRRREHRAWRTLDTKHLGSPFQLLSQISELENAHDGLSLHRVDISDELRRIAQRQFHWQRGKLNKAAFFKAGYLYTFPEAADYFHDKHGVSIHDFCYSGFALAAMLRNHAGVVSRPTVKDLPIDPATLAKCIGMYARPEAILRQQAETMAQVTTHAAYQSSVLRLWPCVLFEEQGVIVAPITDLVIERFTNGLYYDLVDNSGQLRALIGKRFESLCRLLLEAFLPDLNVILEFKYGPAKRRLDSPDLFLVDGGETVAIIECKGKKAPISVKLGDEVDPLRDPAFAELAKGAFQIWRFVSHVRRGLVETPGGKLAKDVPGLVLLMDTWLEMSGNQMQDVLARARQTCAQNEPEILSEDQIPVAFCNVDEFENVLRSTTTAGFLRTIKEASAPERGGWLLSSLKDDIAVESQDKGDPFESHLEQVIKWWPKQ
jgi:hypothetical protein